MKAKDMTISQLWPHNRFNNSASAGFRSFIGTLLNLKTDNPMLLTDICDYIVNIGRVKNIAMESCFGCREGAKFCCQCILDGSIDPGHIFIGLMRADNKGKHKVRIAYICSAKCLQLVRAGPGESVADDIKDNGNVASASVTFEQKSAPHPASVLISGSNEKRHYHYSDDMGIVQARTRDAFYIEDPSLPMAIILFNTSNADRLLRNQGLSW